MIEGLGPYPKYKDSGIAVLGQVPEHWTERRLDRLFDLRNDSPQPGDQRVTGYLSGRVTLRTNVLSQRIKGVVKDGGWKRVHPGDFAISGMNAHLGGMGVSDSFGKCSPIYLILIPKPGTNAHFVSHSMRSIAHQGALLSFVNTIRFNSADFKRDALKLFRIFLPDEQEQTQIVRFLNNANNTIGRTILAEKGLIDLFQEQKQRITQHAVTRGLDPGVQMRDSGVQWIGEIPAHWETRRIKYLLRDVDRRSMTGNEPLLSMRMHHGLVIFSDHFSRPPQAASLVGFKIVSPGQFVVNRMQAGNGVIFPSRLDGLVSPDYAVFEPLVDVNIDYLGELFRCPLMRTKFRSESKGLGTGSSGFLRLYNDRFGAISVPVPPRSEQDSIIKELGSQMADLNAAIERAEREITLLHEYRTRLTADIVTGKFDVREAASKLPDPSAVPQPEVVDEDVLDDHQLGEGM
jgi:type I restriction enzyme S subunit